MRILVISNLYPPNTFGGYEIRCSQVCKGLAQRGHFVRILTSKPYMPVEELEPDIIRVERSLLLINDFTLPPLISRQRLYEVRRANYNQTMSAIRRHSPDVVFLWSQRRLTVASFRAVHDSGVPFCYSMGDDHFVHFLPQRFQFQPRAFYRYLRDTLFRRDLHVGGIVLPDVHFLSDMLRREVIAKGVAIQRAKVIYRGIPLAEFPMKAQPGVIQKPPRLLYAGLLLPAKGVHTLLEAVERMEDMGHRAVVTIVGEGEGDRSYCAALRKRAESLDSSVSFLGRLQHSALSAIYRANDILVFPSIWNEPFGAVHMEAMASGTPVVSSIGGGQDEFLVHEENALTFAKEDARGLAEQILRLVRHPTLAQDLASRARKCIEERFAYDDYILEMERWLVEAVCAQDGALENAPDV